MDTRIRKWLEGSPSFLFMAWALTGAFGTYFCMYGFRKPFAVGEYLDFPGFPFLPAVSLKAVLIVSQVLGYCFSKFIGIKVVSEMPAHKRGNAILSFILFAQLALVAFALVPPPWNALLLFFNGLPLGMIWGLVFSFLEGRKTSDLLGAGLCASFIVASGFTKSVGRVVLEWVPEVWMPAVTGGLFLVPLSLFVWMLKVMPPPSAEDIEERSERRPIDAAERRAFLRQYGFGILSLVVGYVLLTAYREFRDNFAREIWDALGYQDAPSIMTMSEIPIALGSLFLVAMLIRVRDNRFALRLIHGAMAFGAILTVSATALFQAGVIAPATWMILVGLGLYVGYVPFNCVLFDRLIAATRSLATAAFLIYVADAFGYLGVVGLTLFKDFASPDLSWLAFFTSLSYVAPVVWGGMFLVAGAYFSIRIPAKRA